MLAGRIIANKKSAMRLIQGWRIFPLSEVDTGLADFSPLSYKIAEVGREGDKLEE